MIIGMALQGPPGECFIKEGVECVCMFWCIFLVSDFSYLQS